MTPIQQLMLGVGAKKKTYLDDVFSTQVYAGTGSARSINNGIDLAGEGGMVWNKIRSEAYNHALFDTVRSNGSTHNLRSNSNNEVYNYGNTGFTSWNNNGYSLGSDTVGEVNFNNQTYASWTFRKAPGFFDVVTWTGNGTARTIAHSLGSVPGCILIKCTTSAFNWRVYHRGANGGVNPEDYGLSLNTTTAEADNATYFNDTLPTSTHFTIGTNATVNSNGSTYVAYVFAGGASTNALASAVDFDGSSDSLEIPDSADFHFGSGDFCVELWVKSTDSNTNKNLVGQWASSHQSWSLYWSAPNQGHTGWGFKYNPGSGQVNLTDTLLDDGHWHHIAAVRNGNDLCLYRDGILRKKADVSGVTLIDATTPCRIADDGYFSAVDCHISNVRVVKGSPVYTSSFRVPTEPLTNITNTKLLCCNGTSITSSTVTPGTITSNGNPTSSTVTPFDDPAAFTFGESGSESVIKCGSYVGNGSTTGLEINLGFEPQWLMIKMSSATGSWGIFDNMRKIVTGGSDHFSIANGTNSEYNFDAIDLTSTGFKITASGSVVNGSDEKFTYMAIRRPDPLVQKPQLATDVFAMDVGNSSTGIPNFDSGFPVDYALLKEVASTANWHSLSRLTGDKYLNADQNIAEQSYSNFKWDSNEGWYNGNVHGSAFQSWMWKRHAGFDVVTYEGKDLAGHAIPHSLNKVPEMIWVKRRDANGHWTVYHVGANNGSTPQDWALYLNLTDPNYDWTAWNDTLPTSTHFSLGTGSYINHPDSPYIAMLFASVDGISKVGSYTGDDSDDGSHVIDVGFTPRFLIIKRADGSADWKVFDTTNGFPTSGTANYLELNTTDARYTGSGVTVTKDTNGFKLWSPGGPYNANNGKYIYYAHA